MATLSFKSVGKTAQTLSEEDVEVANFPIGIRTPLSLSDIDGPLTMNYLLDEQLADNLRNLLQTNFGERLGLYNFGANLKPLTVNFSSQDSFDSEALKRIATAISQWMPYVEPVDYVSEVDRTQVLNTALIRINITYNVPSVGIVGKKIQTVLYVI